MNRFLFLKSEFIKKFLLFVVALWIFGFFKIILGLLLVAIIICFLFRRKKVIINDIRQAEVQLLHAPVSGRVKSIKKNPITTEVIIQSSLLKGFGIYMPLGGEITDTKQCAPSEAKFYQKIRTIIYIKGKNQQQFKLSITTLGLFKPRIFVKPGDRGRLGAEIGHMSFFAGINFQISNDYALIPKQGDFLDSSQSVLAKME